MKKIAGRTSCHIMTGGGGGEEGKEGENNGGNKENAYNKE